MKRLLLVFTFFWALFLPVFAQNASGTEWGKTEKPKREVAQDAPKSAAPTTSAPTEAPKTRLSMQENLPQLSPEMLQTLWDSCTLVDYTYFTMPITMSLDRQASVRSSLRHIGMGVVAQKADCKLFAKLFYQIKGQIVMTADMFFSENSCSYVVYSIGGKPTFANPISTEGVQFLNQIIERQKAKKP
jgi:hypothetical protein